jgi:hypothetical protein
MWTRKSRIQRRFFRHFCALTTIVCVVGCGRNTQQQSGVPEADSLDKIFTKILESSWNYYIREEIFLGPTYFGNSTTFGRHGTSLHALALLSDYPAYHALATKGLIRLDELSVADAPPSVFSAGGGIERAATVSVTDEGRKRGTIDTQANTVTFQFGTYRVEKIAVNTEVPTCEGTYHLVEGTRTLSISSEFSDVWAELGWPTSRDGRFRALFKFDTTNFSYQHTRQAWQVATASNGRFSAQDTGPLDGNYDSDNVPPTVEQIRRTTCVVR